MVYYGHLVLKVFCITLSFAFNGMVFAVFVDKKGAKL